MNNISIKIGRWYEKNKRDLPWRQTKDAYRIWLSEIILQQTRVNQGMDYYLRFVKRFPTVKELAEAQQDEVLKLWQGLGYYSRARNLHSAAQQVVNNYNNKKGNTDVSFPTTYAELIKLKGVGPYTAAAIASFSSGEKVAVVDGNVYRVLSRLFDIETPIDSTQGQKEFLSIASQLLSEKDPGHHNQAMMEFGALCCTPSSPQCLDCPVADHCLAFERQTIFQRPIKAGKVKIRERHLSYLIYIYKDSLWVHQRGEGDIWQGLWEFVIDEEQEQQRNEVQKQPKNEQPAFSIKHQLTHQTLYADFYIRKIEDKKEAAALEEELQPKGYKRVTWIEWQQLAVPRLIDEANRRIAEAWF